MNKVAIGAAILGLTSVVAADMMSRLAQTGALPTIIFASSDQSLKRLADKFHASAPQLPILALSLGIDSNAVATIPSSTLASPCGEPGQAVLMTHSIGIDGTTVTPFAPLAPPCDRSHGQVVSSDAD
jgi:hypothetical protein